MNGFQEDTVAGKPTLIDKNEVAQLQIVVLAGDKVIDEKNSYYVTRTCC